MNELQDQGALVNAGQIIERFGGIRPMAAKMDVPVTTVQGWKKRNVIPGNRREEVLYAARANGIDLSDLTGGGPANENAYFDDVAAGVARHGRGSASRHEQAILLAAQRMGHSELVRRINDMEKKIAARNALLSAILFALVVGFSGVILLPGHKQRVDYDRRIAALEADMDAGSDLQSKLREVQVQAQAIQSRIADISRRADMLAQGIIGSGGASQGMQAVKAFQGQVADIAGSADFGDLLAKIRQLQDSMQGQEQLSEAITQLNGLIDSRGGSTENLDQALAQLPQDSGALGQTLQGVSPVEIKAAVLLVGLTQFRQSLDRNAPFADDLALMRKLVGDDDPALSAAIDKLAPLAAQGVLSKQGLTDEFKGLAGEIVTASLAGEDVTVKDRAMARLNEVLQVQKNGEMVTGTDTQATVVRAQAMLDRGDVKGAIAELQSLDSNAAQQTAKPWIERAEAALLAQQVQNLLTGKVINRVGNISSPGDFNRMLKQIEALGGARPIALPPASANGSNQDIVPR